MFAAIRGDMDVNETKLKNALKARDLVMMDDDAVRRAGWVAGSASPVGLAGVHCCGRRGSGFAQFDCRRERAREASEECELRTRLDCLHRRGHRSRPSGIALPRCDGQLRSTAELRWAISSSWARSIRRRWAANFLDADGASGHASWDVTALAWTAFWPASIEANHDKDGIIWPREIAPYEVHLVALNLDCDGVREAADRIYADLQAAGIETCTTTATRRPA